MARLFHDGFEYHNSTANYPWTINASSAGSYSTSTIRYGTYSGQISGLTSATRAGWLMQWASGGGGSGPYYVRFYINITTLPSASNTIFSFTNGAALSSTQSLCLKLNSGGTLGLYNLTTQIGSNGSTTLSTGKWYMIEIKFDSTGGASHGIGEVKINGTVEITSSTLTYAITSESFMLGGNLKAESQTQGNWFFDDVALNDSTGANQTGYPGQGNIIRLKPNADGDNHGFANSLLGGTAGQSNNFTRVNGDSMQQTTTWNGDITSGLIDDFNIDNTPSTLGSDATINVVTVDLVARAEDVTGASNIKPRIKKTSGGTVASGTIFTPPTSQVRVVNKSTLPWLPTIVLYNDPDGSAWTKSTLDTTQVGYTLTSTGSCNADATSVSVQVDFTPATSYTLSVTEASVLTEINLPSKIFPIVTSSGAATKILSPNKILSIVEATTLSLLRLPAKILFVIESSFLAKILSPLIVLSSSGVLTSSKIITPQRVLSASGTSTSAILKLPLKILSIVIDSSSSFINSSNKNFLALGTIIVSKVILPTRILFATIVNNPNFSRGAMGNLSVSAIIIPIKTLYASRTLYAFGTSFPLKSAVPQKILTIVSGTSVISILRLPTKILKVTGISILSFIASLKQSFRGFFASLMRKEGYSQTYIHSEGYSETNII